MLAVSQVYGSHNATEAQPAIKTVKITKKNERERLLMMVVVSTAL